MKSVLISIQPKQCELIANDEKTIEVRKTKPNIETPFKVYIYCTNTKPFLVWGDVFRGNWETEFTHLIGYNRKKAEKIWDVFNGKVMGEFVCDFIDEFSFENTDGVKFKRFSALKETCLSLNQIRAYAGSRPVIYGWHISNLVVYDSPKELSEFKNLKGKQIKRPPQSWCYVQKLESEG